MRQLDAEVATSLHEILTASPAAVASTKALIAQVWRQGTQEAAATTAAAIAKARVSSEGQEGLRRFWKSGHRPGPDDQPGAHCQPWRNRAPDHPRLPRNEHRNDRGLFGCGRRAPHVLAADRAVAHRSRLGIESYLSIPTLIAAARAHGADAVHPGYGFLSENAAFARACEQAGLIFVGPPADVISRMGSKIDARRLMQSAGVPIVPARRPRPVGFSRPTRARGVGFPALIKASAGGGGKGDAAVRTMSEAVEAIRRRGARPWPHSATAPFTSNGCSIGRDTSRSRSSPTLRATVHLFERECSAQRRHQKVLEESPSPALTPRCAQRMTQAAVAAAAPPYRNAGTVEFLVDGRGDTATFYFLEMNTRLQVEHAGDGSRSPASISCERSSRWPPASRCHGRRALTQRGHAIEARVYAEDPAANSCRRPDAFSSIASRGCPVSGSTPAFAEGNEVSVHYDPMLAKVIAVGETRDAAIAVSTAALRAYPILGIRTNIPYLLRCWNTRASVR